MIKDFSFKFLPADFRKLYFRFNGEEKDVLQSIGAFKSAIAVLGKHHTELAQVPAEQLIHVAVLIEGQFRKHKDMVNQIASPAQKKAVTNQRQFTRGIAIVRQEKTC